MQLNKKKDLAARTLGVGSERIIFNLGKLAEIKEAITKQDIRDLFQSKAIMIKEIKGRKKIILRKRRRRAGSIKKKIKAGKKEYIITTRKLRRHASELRKKNIINYENYLKLRKEIRARIFRDRAHFKERSEDILKEGKK